MPTRIPFNSILLDIVRALLLSACIGLPSAQAAPPAKIPLLVDTDMGTDIDDAFALALVLASPELELCGVTTVGGDAQTRAWMVCRLLTAVDRREVPVAWGRPPQPAREIEGQFQYRYHPAVLFNRTSQPVAETAVELLYQQLKARPGELTLLATGPLTNVARLLQEHPDCKPWIKQIVLMGGAIRVGYANRPPVEPEANVRADIRAARSVLDSGIPLVVAPLDATAGLQLDGPLRQRIFRAATPLTLQVQALYQLWDQDDPVLYDALAAALCFERQFCELKPLHLEVDDAGLTRVGDGRPNATVAMTVREQEFLNWCADRIAGFGQPALPRALGNRSRLVPRGGMPLRVHTFEDYETDIERRWWLSGKLETDNVPPGSSRACRGVLTQDFDDRMGDLKTMYTAVVFNPVPGPPMGRNTRLSFRYWLRQTDTLRVQLYSLSNGYHRYLTLSGLPQGRWETATVDMTQMRRPDGSGGPLAEDERIDDIQFYVHPAAELLIDDIVLYDAAPPGEPRAFPRRLLFTGWFDTGRQGREWPGDFEIVPHQPPRTWKAVRSVPREPDGGAWIRLHLRGPRRLGETTHLRFRYHLTGSDSLRVVLNNANMTLQLAQDREGLKQDQWDEATLEFHRHGEPAGDDPEGIEEIRFLLPRDAQLLIDDVLLYEPGRRRP